MGILLSAPVWAGTVDFARDVQPVLSRSCEKCHGAKMQMGGLRLDAKTAAMKVLRPGDSAASELYKRVAGLGDQARMPMGGKPLPEAEVALLKRWIEEGAEWPDGVGASMRDGGQHWAYVPPKKAPVPALGGGNAIDAFVFTRLQKEGLAPSPRASKITLLRRLSLDLTGLPPTPAEVDAFVADQSADGYKKQVERLLASPHYGEKWGRWWLDAARYADSDGFEKDKQRQVWFYRDWVIRALNLDMPYNRFIVEQVAGDLLPGATQDQRVATGFLRNSMINEEGGIDPEQFRMEAMFDRMDAIGKGVLGVTIQCAQCHTHKYDPIKHEDYYRLFAFLNNTYEANIAVYTPSEQAQRDAILKQTAEIEEALRRRMPDWTARMAAWAAEARMKNEKTRWVVVRPEVDDISTGGQKYLPMEDGSLLEAGYAPTKHTVKLTAKVSLPKIAAFRLELLLDPNLPLGGPGRAIDGTGALTEFTVERVTGGAKPEKVALASATADIGLPETELAAIFYDKSNKRRVTGPISFAIDGKDETAWGINAGPGLSNVPRKAVFVAAQPIEASGETTLVFLVKQNHGGWNSDDNQNNNLGRFRLSVTDDATAVADPVPAEVRAILDKPPAEQTPDDQRKVFSYWRTTVPEWSAENARITELWNGHPKGSTQLVLAERPVCRETHILERGDFLKPAKLVTPGVPAFLNPMDVESPTRLDFAKWLVDRQSPTTARAVVNRVWQSYFGTGLTATSEDLGMQGEKPSHPELLDWLAVEFMEHGWSLKHLHRLIVESDTYQQTSRVTPELLERDPANRLLARGSRFRVDGEIVQDIALSASGLLNDQVGGASVYPPAPEFLFQPPVSYGPKIWKEEKGRARYRRSIYTFRYRSVPFPMLQTFDSPNGDAACVRRSRSNTPLQALTTLNEPLFMEAAQALADLALKQGGQTDAERITFAFRRCVARPPAGPELSELLTLLKKQEARMEPAQAWTMLARVLLNLDETITRE
ncbi:PSD1 and planctomycete cytochrome C domain-containing protein [uncultured Paludibaculum sp.]|uniref:PSD1 and planctomycete cytochrome C domain-containing protein n=1 Tax=uncultured Paludibaculum sp. TaxID=1765020 RepID=UPI002AAB9C90|nr:PSD1 and planctomycete cytochrome C domain-containing protein [uncultured Paludibaculum sp.]